MSRTVSNTERGPRHGRRRGLINPAREPVHGLSSILPRSAVSLRSPLSGPNKHVSRPCRSLSVCRIFDEFKLCGCHADFEPCRLALFGGLGRPAHSLGFYHAVIVRQKSSFASLTWVLSIRTISADKKSCRDAETSQQPSTIELSPNCGLGTSILGESSQRWEVFAVIAIVCQHERSKKFGKTTSGAPRMRCKDCGKTWTESTAMLDGMRIGLDRAVQVVTLLCEGMAVRAVARVTDVSVPTILDLLTMLGEKCADMEAERIRDVQVEDVEVDEIWGYVYCKAATAERKKIVGGCGDAWCFTAIEKTSKLMLCWHMGRRTLEDTERFTWKLSRATIGHFQLSSDGWQAYPLAVRWHLGGRVDHGRIIKSFVEGPKDERRKYSPSKIVACKKDGVLGLPWRDRICTSHAERANGTIRHFVKRMTRLTCAFSKRWDNHRAALGLFFAHYNWCRVHRSLRRQTPAMASGLATHVWSVRELIQNVSNR